jgi:RHS repeat-associated protein
VYAADAYGDVASGPGGVSYGYDALGRLVSRSAGSSTASLSYLGTSSALSSDGTSDYAYDPSGSLVAAQAGGAGYATLSDQHGDLTALFGVTSSTSGLAGSASYSGYGTVTESGLMPQVGYQGDYTDPATGLVMMGARWYDPATGSFTSNDTIAGSPLPSTVDGNPYAYTSGNPLSETDPSGHSILDDIVSNSLQAAEQVIDPIGSLESQMLPYEGDAEVPADSGGLSFWEALGEVAAPVTAFAAVMWPTGINGNGTCAVTCNPQPNSPTAPSWNPAPGVCSVACSVNYTFNTPPPCTPITCPPPKPPSPRPPPCSVDPASCHIGPPPKAITSNPVISHTVSVATNGKAACKAGPCILNATQGNASHAGGTKIIQTSSGDNNGSGATVTQDQTPQPAAAGAGASNGKGGGGRGCTAPEPDNGPAIFRVGHNGAVRRPSPRFLRMRL